MSLAVPKLEDLTWTPMANDGSYVVYVTWLLGVELHVDHDLLKKRFSSYLPCDPGLGFYDSVELADHETLESAKADAYRHGLNLVNYAKRLLKLED